ncbi:MAG: hypothetical protein LBF04_02065 [Prevotellaceae bacterium]|jgi:hypothetical protein|nr:hypothetical protein [Prevotellaceae bacterium]
MDLEKFLEKYLPDYQAKVAEVRDKYDISYFSAATTQEIAVLVGDTYFPEALQNFADRVCEKQKAKCAHLDLRKHAAVLFVEQPKIEEL